MGNRKFTVWNAIQNLIYGSVRQHPKYLQLYDATEPELKGVIRRDAICPSCFCMPPLGGSWEKGGEAEVSAIV